MPEISLEQACDLAREHYRAGLLAEAESVCRLILQAQPTHAITLNLLGNVCQATGRLEEAVECYQKSLATNPNLAEACNNLGSIQAGRGWLVEAMTCFQQALAINPDCAEIHYNLGNAYQEMDRTEEAPECYQRALAIRPDLAEAHINIGNLRHMQGRFEEAVACHSRAMAISPGRADSYYNLGNAHHGAGRPDQAVDCYRQALAIDPNLAQAHNNLGNVFKDQGLLDEAIEAYRRAMSIKPDFAFAHGNLVYTLQFHPDYDATAVHAEHRAWNQRHAQPLRACIHPHLNDRNPDRSLRIGYVSADLREHPVGRFLLPLLQNHDRRHFDVYCYAHVPCEDDFANRLRACATAWRPVWGLSDEQMAGMIRADRIDILVDLSLHTAYNRLLVFARKPAPVQVTYLGYCGTTGMDTIDYRITDPFLDPPGQENLYYSEHSALLPRTYWCYQAPASATEPGPLPALAAGHVTFGCLNNFCKVSRPGLSAWCRLLRKVPSARLLLHSIEGSHRQRVRSLLAGEGLDPRRLDFVAHQPRQQYFEMHRRIDIALDPFPYNGGATTCDALWMGVPVVSLAGRTAMGRAGLSLLSNIGLPELVAQTEEEYVKIAADLACDLPRLGELRRTLRQRMQSSPLMDATAFARDMEAAYRRMWWGWCTGETGICAAPRPTDGHSVSS